MDQRIALRPAVHTETILRMSNMSYDERMSVVACSSPRVPSISTADADAYTHAFVCAREPGCVSIGRRSASGRPQPSPSIRANFRGEPTDKGSSLRSLAAVVNIAIALSSVSHAPDIELLSSWSPAPKAADPRTGERPADGTVYVEYVEYHSPSAIASLATSLSLFPAVATANPCSEMSGIGSWWVLELATVTISVESRSANGASTASMLTVWTYLPCRCGRASPSSSGGSRPSSQSSSAVADSAGSVGSGVTAAAEGVPAPDKTVG